MTLARPVAPAREHRQERSASLTVRSPPAPVRRLVDACGVSDLVEPKEADAWAGERPALGPAHPRPGTRTRPPHLGQGAGLRAGAVPCGWSSDGMTRTAVPEKP